MQLGLLPETGASGGHPCFTRVPGSLLCSFLKGVPGPVLCIY